MILSFDNIYKAEIVSLYRTITGNEIQTATFRIVRSQCYEFGEIYWIFLVSYQNDFIWLNISFSFFSLLFIFSFFSINKEEILAYSICAAFVSSFLFMLCFHLYWNIYRRNCCLNISTENDWANIKKKIVDALNDNKYQQTKLKFMGKRISSCELIMCRAIITFFYILNMQDWIIENNYIFILIEYIDLLFRLVEQKSMRIATLLRWITTIKSIISLK